MTRTELFKVLCDRGLMYPKPGKIWTTPFSSWLKVDWLCIFHQNIRGRFSAAFKISKTNEKELLKPFPLKAQRQVSLAMHGSTFQEIHAIAEKITVKFEESTMACKLRKAIGLVKDQTSISLAKVSNAANLEVSILKATTHDEIRMENRYVNEIVKLVSSNKVYAAACAQSIGKRIGRTRNWVVALKSLMLVLRIFQDGDPYFPREIFHAMKRGAKILNLSSFKDDSTSNSWDYTAFVRTFALYLDERLDCFLTGKLQRRFVYHQNGIHGKKMKNNNLYKDSGIKDMKPTLVLDRITHWQKLLDRAMGSRPTGLAKKNCLVKISLYAIVQESFDLYRDISDGLVVILDNFFQFPYKACVVAFNACVKSSKQFTELSKFYAWCASLGVGRTFEYPSVQKVSDELMETLQEFLKDQASLSADNGESQSPLAISKPNLRPPSTPKDSSSSVGQDEAYQLSETPKKPLEDGPECGSPSTLLKDPTSATNDTSLSLTTSLEQEFISLHCGQDEKQPQNDGFASENDSGSTSLLPIVPTESSSFDMFSFDDFQQVEQQKNQRRDQEQNAPSGSNSSSRDCWDLVLAEIEPKPKQATPNKSSNNGISPSILEALYDEPYSVPQPQYNPFLEDIATIAPSTTKNYKAGFADFFHPTPTFQATTPTFCAHNPREATLSSTFTSQSSNSKTSLALTLDDLNGLTIAPTFGAQASSETEISVGPNVQIQSLDKTFYVPGSYEIVPATTFGAHNSNEKIRAPTFSTENHNMAMTIPTPAPYPHNQNANGTMLSSDLWTQNFNGTKAEAPTFCAKNYNETKVATPTTRDDPFEAWFNAMANSKQNSIELK
ncbi:clathrin coat assembly protein AP180 [Senna tora]|uniref:Clathrin coat assembly protein AP180 n=1 Tax=Senna tora TaxID=362788 RepID=A0A834WVC2_9FABA|nr:clathrin coat assembly protein AP180 [Senna tora]